MIHARSVLALALSVTLAGALWAGTGTTPGVSLSSFCLCAANAPCGNADPDSGCANSAGIGANLSASGTTSVSADDLFLSATDLPLQYNTALLVASTNSKPATPFGPGLLCIGDPLGRIQVAGGFEPLTFGPVVGKINASGSGFVVGAGDTLYLQAWYRDIGQSQPCGVWLPYNLTGGIQAQLVN